MDLAIQRELFSEVLDELETRPDLTNQIPEVTLEDDEAGIEIDQYAFSPEWNRLNVGLHHGAQSIDPSD
jgi:hypothetical protein